MSSVNSFLPFTQNQGIFDTAGEPNQQLITEVFRLAGPSVFFKLVGLEQNTINATLMVTNNYDPARSSDTNWEPLAEISSTSTEDQATIATPFVYGRLIITGGKGRLDVSVSDSAAPASSASVPTVVTANTALPVKIKNHVQSEQGDALLVQVSGAQTTRVAGHVAAQQGDPLVVATVGSQPVALKGHVASQQGDALVVAGTTDVKIKNHNAAEQGDRVTTEPLGRLGVGRQIDVSSGGNTVTLTSTCTRFTVLARGGDIRIAMGSTIPNSSTGALLMENGERDYTCAAGSSISAIKAAHEDAATVVLEIIELI